MKNKFINGNGRNGGNLLSVLILLFGILVKKFCFFYCVFLFFFLWKELMLVYCVRLFFVLILLMVIIFIFGVGFV